MNKNQCIAVIGSLLALSMSGPIKAQRNDLPNIVLFLGDDISYDDFGCYGNPVVKTPNIERDLTNMLVF